MKKTIAGFPPRSSAGDNDTNICQKSRGWTPSCNQQDFQEICERCEAKHPPVMFPDTKRWKAYGGVEDKCDARESKSKKKSMKSVSLISDTCGCGETYSRIHVILTSCGKKNQYVL